jgi:hypothetical protein
MGTDGYSLRVKQLEHEAGRLRPSGDEVMNGGPVSPFPLFVFLSWCLMYSTGRMLPDVKQSCHCFCDAGVL